MAKKSRVVLYTVADTAGVRVARESELIAAVRAKGIKAIGGGASRNGRASGGVSSGGGYVVAAPTIKPVDVELSEDAVKRAAEAQRAAITQIYRAIERLSADLDKVAKSTPRVMSPVLQGTILNPDGSPAAGVTIAAERPGYVTADAVGKPPAWASPTTQTDPGGSFALNLPVHPVPGGGLKLAVRSGHGAPEALSIDADALEAGEAGVITLKAPARAMQARRALTAARPASVEAFESEPSKFTGGGAEMRLGEENGDGAITFRSNDVEISKHRYNVLIRLTDPLLSANTPVLTIDVGGKKMVAGSMQELIAQLGLAGVGDADLEARLKEAIATGTVELRQRVPVMSPIDVPGFQQSLETSPGKLAKAASLGLGYIVGMQQVWMPAGYSLGDLVYSLPLAPGEEQRIAISERNESMSLRESESFEESEQVTLDERADSSAESVFTSAVNDRARGGSHMESSTTTWGVGGAVGAAGVIPNVPMLLGGGAAGGVAQTNASGESSSWQNSSRDAVSSATEDLHSSLARQASARRRAQRTSVRLATASDRRSAVTKVIANHNHSHALTIQYWEVLRHFEVTSRPTDVQLVCFVPLQLVDFLDGEPREIGTLAAGGQVSRDRLLARYGTLLRFIDVIARSVARTPLYREGARHLRRLAADPTIQIEGASASGTVKIEFSGTFLPYDDVEATLVLRGGRRLRARRAQSSQPVGLPAPDTLRTWDDVLQALRVLRRSTLSRRMTTSVVLPPGVNPEQIIAVELRRRSTEFSFKINPFGTAGGEDVIPASVAAGAGVLGSLLAARSRTFSGRELDELVGPPVVWNITVTIPPGEDPDITAYEHAADAIELTDVQLIDAGRIAPIMTFDELLKIEALFQHVVRNTAEFSKAVWAALTAEERAMMLERFTIGMPEGGLANLDEEVPLLSCVTNRVLGFFGNSMVMPFDIPIALADKLKKSSRTLQDLLLKFHRQAYQPARSTLTLPTRGVLAEAVLGRNNASEKIDLTRFWNWKDSPHTAAADPAGLTAGEGLLRADMRGPSELAQRSTVGDALAAMINAGRPEVAGALARALAQEAGRMPSGAAGLNLTGLDQLSRAMDTTTASATEAFKTSVSGAVDIGVKAMEMLPSSLDAAARFDQVMNPSRRAREDAETAAAKAKGEETQRESTRKAQEFEDQQADRRVNTFTRKVLNQLAFGQLIGASSSSNSIEAIGDSGDPAKALAAARLFVSELPADVKPRPGEINDALVALRTAVEQDGTNPKEKLGLWALGQALGLPAEPAPQ